MGTAGWVQAEADRVRLRTVLRAPPDWRAPATTSVPASTTEHGAPADVVRTGGHTLDPAQPRAGGQAETVAKHAPEVAATSAPPQISRKAAGASWCCSASARAAREPRISPANAKSAARRS